MRLLMLVLAAAVLSMGQRCPTEPTPPPCASAPPQQPTRDDVAAAYQDGFEDGQESCPAAPEPEPCPTCDVAVNDDEVADQAIRDFVGLIHSECFFGHSVVDAGNIDREVKLRIQNLHQYGYCR